MAKIRIALDAMGGDNAPRATCEGAAAALRAMEDVSILLFGRLADMREALSGLEYDQGRLELIDAPEVIDMHEPPMLAVRRKANSSMVLGMLSLREGRAQAFVSAGSTGALLAGGMTRLGRIQGVERPALAPVLPSRKGPFMLIDSGANVDCQPEYLLRFGLMGAVYMERVLGVKAPRVGLVNIGTEKEKGNQLSRAAHELMAAQRQYQFIGNVEAREIMAGEVDVLVADGFDGNIILKHTEGLAKAMMGMLKDEMRRDLRSKLGALLLKPALYAFRDKLDYESHGGAPLLGVEGALIKAHGSSSARAIQNAIAQARTMALGRVVDTIRAGVARLTDA